jgi:hypothetical protein
MTWLFYFRYPFVLNDGIVVYDELSLPALTVHVL